MSATVTARRLRAQDYARLAAAFGALARRADAPNLHMAPAAVAAAMASGRVAEPVILAAFTAESSEDLVGIWVFHRMRGARTGFASMLEAPLVPIYEVSSAPVLDRAHAEAAAAALVALIATAPDLPKLLRLPLLPVEGPVFEALQAACRGKHHAITRFESWQRPMMRPVAGEDAERYLRRALGSGYKKRLQQHRMLERAGILRFERHRGQDAVAALETFLTLEASGWKGTAGTALAKRPADCAYIRQVAARFAAIDGLRIDLLRLNEAPIAAGLLLDLAGQAHFLKIAFDETRAKLSPGRALTIEMLRADLGTNPDDAAASVTLDSGAGDRVDAGTYVWGERQAMANVMIDLGSPLAPLAALAGHARMRLRDWRDRRAKGSQP